jgi:hypothetical protein
MHATLVIVHLWGFIYVPDVFLCNLAKPQSAKIIPLLLALGNFKIFFTVSARFYPYQDACGNPMAKKGLHQAPFTLFESQVSQQRNIIRILSHLLVQNMLLHAYLLV